MGVTETATVITADMETTAVSREAALPEAGGVISGQAEAITPETTVPETAAPMEMAAMTGIREAAEMTTEPRTATATGVKTAAARTTIQARTGGTGCSGREVA